MQRALVLFTIFILGMSCASVQQRPEKVVEQFYTTYIAAKPAGLPDGETLQRLAPYLSPRLHDLIIDALKYRSEMIERHPGEKPPFVDGDHFTSVFEGPRAFEILRTDGENVHVRFTHEPNITWEDIIVVKDGRIDDVIYGGAGDFNPSGRLTERLRARE